MSPALADAAAALPTGIVVPQSPFLGVVPDDLANAPNKKPIFIPLNALNVAAGTVGRARYQADVNQALVLYLPTLIARVTADKSLVADPAIDVQITDAKGFSFIANDTTDAAALFGTGRNPAVLPLPFVLRGGNALNFTFTNRGAAAWDIHALLSGFIVGA